MVSVILRLLIPYPVSPDYQFAALETSYLLRTWLETDELIFQWMLIGLSTTKLLLLPCRQTEALSSLETLEVLSVS